MLEKEILRYLNTHPEHYEPELDKKIRLLLRWLEYGPNEHITLSAQDAINIAKRISVPPKRPFFKKLIPNWKIRFMKWIEGRRQLSH